MKLITKKDIIDEKPHCDECGDSKEKVVEMTGVVDESFWVCEECLKKAISILQKEKNKECEM